MKHIRTFAFLVLLPLIQACYPTYQTTYELVPAETMEGRKCSNECITTTRTCKQKCQATVSGCQLVEYTRSQAGYVQYLKQRETDKTLPARTPESFYDNNACDTSSCIASCEGDYHMCHTNCGGRVIPHTVCTSNCD